MHLFIKRVQKKLLKNENSTTKKNYKKNQEEFFIHNLFELIFHFYS
jgi:hypothetical protein